MTRRAPLLALTVTLACNGDPAGTSTSATTGDPGDTTTAAAPTTSAPLPDDTTSAGTGSDGATTGPVPTTTGPADPSTSSGATTTDASTTAPVDPCDPDPCMAPDHCEDGQCIGPPRPLAGEVIVVEMMIDPSGLSDYDAEWFELLNITDQHLDLDGCRLLDLGVNDNDHTIDAGGPLVIGPGALMVMAKTVDPDANGGIAGVAYGFAQAYSLTNTGDAFILRCDDIDVDTVEFDPMTWPYGVGIGMQLDPGQQDATANDDPSAWCAATAEYVAANTGTPGAANPACR